VKHRVRNWLIDHPKVLSTMFLVATVAAEKVPEITTKSGSSSYQGP
jgi:hypothetical protein